MTHRHRFSVRFVAIALPLILTSAACQKGGAVSPTAKLLFVADEACTVSLDGSPVSALEAGAPVATEVEPGEHLVSAVTADGRRYEEEVNVQAGQQVVRLRFGEGTGRQASKAKPAGKESTRTASRSAPADSDWEWEQGGVKGYGSIRTYTDVDVKDVPFYQPGGPGQDAEETDDAYVPPPAP